MPFKPVEPKPDFTKLEEEILKFWEANHVFEKTLEKTKQGQPYTFYDGPPFATGLPHYGHILASTVKDLFPRYQTMKGKYVRRRWGWDCHGLPIEELVERKLGISGKKQIEEMGIEKFNETCRSMVLQFADEWKKMVRRIARWVEFDNSYKTMDRDYMESVWWAFKQIYDKGLVYEGRRVLLYCPRCETPISNFEVAMDNSYKEVTEEAVTVKFKVKDQDNTYILAWTTTPWTLPGNVALAVGADIDYVKVKSGDEFYIAAKDLAPSGEAVETMKGKDLVGWEYEPLFEVPAVKSDKSYKVYAADFVTTEEGTGVVHTAVVYGEDDYNLGIREGLPIVPLLDEKGIFNEQSPELVRGKYFKESEKSIKKDLETRGLMFEKKQHQHSYPHCWRCSTALFYNAIPAWFMNIQKIKDGILKTNEEQVNWYPSHLKHGRYQKSVEAAPDWNISRNRYWGNPIPVWKCEDCKENTVVGSIKELGLGRNVFLFSRHGEAEHNVKSVISCYPEKETYNLTEKGVERARGLGTWVKEQGGVDMIFSSDLTRTRQTAENAAAALNVPIEFDARLREFNFGTYNGKSNREHDPIFTFEKRWREAPEGGETNQQAQQRMLDFVQDINKRFNGKKILVVSHGDPLYLLMQYYGSELSYPKYATAFELDVSIPDLHRPYIDQVVLECKKCGGKAHRISEIFDSWVEAGSMPFAEYHYPFDNKETFESRFPAQFVSEYIAQTRAWFYVMHVVAFNLFGKAPFEHVVTSGTIMAEDWSKLSKSKQNYPDPWKVIDQYGVDTLRFYLMNSVVMQADNINFSDKALAVTYRKNFLILWNIYNYFVTYANQEGFEPSSGDLSRDRKYPLDQWIVVRTEQLINEVTKYLDSYDTVRATRTIEDYIDDLSTWYLRRSRGRKDSDFFDVLRHCLLIVSRVMAPIAPYISEEIFKNLTRRDIISVHMTPWPEGQRLTEKDEQVLKAMEIIREAVTVGLAARKELKLSVKQPLPRLAVDTKLTDVKLTPDLLDILLSELNVKQVDLGLVEEAKSNNKIFGFPGSANIQYFYLDTAISDELRLEGLARQLERLVQDLRKQQGLKVGEIINLSYDTDDLEIISAFELFDKKKTYVSQIEHNKQASMLDFELNGKKVSLGINR